MTHNFVRRGYTEIQRRGHAKMETEVMHHNPRSVKDCCPHQKLGERHQMDTLSEPPEGTKPNLLISQFQTSGLLNNEKRYFDCFKPPSLYNLLWQPRQTNIATEAIA